MSTDVSDDDDLDHNDLKKSTDDEAAGLGLDLDAPADFYDPDADDRNQTWVTKLLQGRKSDALLTCPGCFTTICLDCQQHSTYENQFRAMFVMNCRLDLDHIITPSGTKPSSSATTTTKERNSMKNGGNNNDDEIDEFNMVYCSRCGTEVGLREAVPDGIYTFFNIIASNA